MPLNQPDIHRSDPVHFAEPEMCKTTKEI